VTGDELLTAGTAGAGPDGKVADAGGTDAAVVVDVGVAAPVELAAKLDDIFLSNVSKSPLFTPGGALTGSGAEGTETLGIDGGTTGCVAEVGTGADEGTGGFASTEAASFVACASSETDLPS
jgi:hypothetical protein